MGYRKWDSKEIERLEELINGKLSYRQIGFILGRTYESVRKKSWKLGLKSSFPYNNNMKDT